MNRIEIVGLFIAMKELMNAEKYDSVKTIVDAVLNEAQTKPAAKPTKDNSKTK